jgi:lysophospholipase L1-like esterase
MTVNIHAGSWRRGLLATVVAGGVALFAPTGQPAAAAAAAAPAAATAGRGDVRVMPLGDSITAGDHGGYRRALEDLLAEARYPVDFVGSRQSGPAVDMFDRDHEGHSGKPIQYLLDTIEGRLKVSRPQTILLHIGTNDMKPASARVGAKERLSALIDKIFANAPEATLLVGTLIPGVSVGNPENAAAADVERANETRKFNGHIVDIVRAKSAAGRPVQLVDMKDVKPADLSDGTHPTRPGYDKMATAWFDALKSVLPTATPPASLGAVGPVATITCPAGSTMLEPADPAKGVDNQDWKAAVEAAGAAGRTFCFRSGRYTGFSVRPQAGQKFYGTPGTVLDGSVTLTGAAGGNGLWTYSGVAANPVPEDYDLLCAAQRPACTLTDDLHVGGIRLTRVAAAAKVSTNKYFIDAAAKKLYLGTDPTGRTVSLTRTPYAFDGASGAANVEIRNLVVQRYATPGHEFVVGGASKPTGWTVEHLDVRENHGGGIAVHGGQARRNRVQWNGHQGIGGGGRHTVVENNDIAYNNVAGYSIADGAAEGGAGKFANTVSIQYRHNWVHDNFGQGIWFDIYNGDAHIEHNTVHDNEGVGIMYEISRSGYIQHNDVRGNGAGSRRFAPEGGKAYAYSAGILVSSSENVLVAHNTVVVPPVFLHGMSSKRGYDKYLGRDSWKVKETTHGIIVLQGARTEPWANCSLNKDKTNAHLIWGCDAKNVTVRDNRTVFQGTWAPPKVIDPATGKEFVDPKTGKPYPSDGKGASGSGLLAKGESRNAVVTFKNNRYEMSNCADKRWFWLTLDLNAPDPSTAELKGASGSLADAQDVGLESKSSRCDPSTS